MWEVKTKYTVGDARPDWVRGMMPCQLSLYYAVPIAERYPVDAVLYCCVCLPCVHYVNRVCCDTVFTSCRTYLCGSLGGL